MTLVAPDEKIDWFRVIVDLERSGYCHASIAMVIGRSKGSIDWLKKGGTPAYERGAQLLELWQDVTGNGQETVPKVKRNSYLA